MASVIEQAVLVLPVGARDHRQGPDNAPVTLVEYGDYECPYCGQAHPIVKEVQKRLGDRLRFVFRHFPLTTMHPHAEHAAEAAEAAGAQGHFWAMHDLLFEHQNRLDGPYLVQYATLLRLDAVRFADEIAQRVHAPKLREDFLSGARSGVNGTPTFFINGIRYDGSWDVPTLVSALLHAAT